MKAERIILSFIAVLVGLGVAGIAFYLYQMTKTVPPPKPKSVALNVPSPTPDSEHYLAIQEPKDEDVVDKKTITVSGQTTPDATVVVTTESDEQIVKPATNGSFSAQQSIDDGVNIIQITAIFPTGEERRITKTITYSSESF